MVQIVTKSDGRISSHEHGILSLNPGDNITITNDGLIVNNKDKYCCKHIKITLIGKID